MTALEKLHALGFDRANRIAAEKVNRWTLDSDGYWCDDVGRVIHSANYKPCTDLNHAKMVVDKLDPVHAHEWYSIMWRTSRDNKVRHYDFLNAPADARIAAVFEALNLWPTEEKGSK